MHLRYRAKGQATHYFKAMPGTEAFMLELAQCRSGTLAPKVSAVSAATRLRPGSMSALIALYYGSPEFQGLRNTTKVTYRGILERFRADYGELMVAGLTRQHIKDILGVMADRPSAANNLLDRIKSLMRFAIDAEWRDTDPTHLLRGYRIETDGFHSWTEQEIAQYQKRHPPGSKARLALALFLFTGQRRSDVVTMGHQHILDGRIRVKQVKTGAMLSIPMHPELVRELASLPEDNATFLVTEFGKPWSAAGFGNRMRDWCDQAGLPQCSAHGLRKAAARRLAEAGCTNQQIKAITGHKTDREVSRYTAAASQIILSDQAIQAIGGSKPEPKMANRRKKNG